MSDKRIRVDISNRHFQCFRLKLEGGEFLSVFHQRKSDFLHLFFQALLIFCGIFLLSSRTWPLEPAKEFFQFHLDTWKTGRGLPENTVYCILQCRDGYIWLGTAKGLVRFDGVRFKVFDKKAPRQLSKYLVRSLYEDGKP